MQEKQLHVSMPDGSVWAVPARVIAEKRAAYYAEHDTGQKSGPEYDEVFRQEVELALDDPAEVIDFARNSMDWEDVATHAKQVKPASPVDFQEGWVNGDMEIVEGSTKPSKEDGLVG